MNRIPIRLRIALLASLAAALTAVVIGFFALTRSEAAATAEFEAHLREEVSEAAIAVEGGLPFNAFQHVDPSHEMMRMALYDQSGVVVESSDEVSALFVAATVGVYFDFDDELTGEPFRGVGLPVVRDDGSYLLVGASPTRELTERMESLRMLLAVLAVLSTILAGYGAYILTGMVLDPIERLRASALDIADEPAGRRLDLPPARDEVRRLAETLNGALDRIDESVEVQRRFLANASHELRTPIARLRAEIDVARRPERTHQDLVAALSRFDDHALHLTTLANNFLAELVPNRTPLQAPRLVSVNEIVVNLRNLTTNGDEIHIDVPRETGSVSILTEPSLLIGVLSNMIGNAFTHGAPPVEVSVRMVDDRLAFAVADCGPGIAADLRAKVVEPYQQGTGATEGTGLGLAIVNDYAISHGGELVVEDADPGCRIVLYLPLDTVNA